MARSNDRSSGVVVRNTQPSDFPEIIRLSERIYPHDDPWLTEHLQSHLYVFPAGQFVAEEVASGRIVGMAASLIIRWDEYKVTGNWFRFTDNGYFTNHDPENGRTLYGAEIMVEPSMQGRGIGKKIYAARRNLCRDLRLRRIRAGARLRGYGRYAEKISAEEYVLAVIRRELYDPTLTFQLRQGFRVISVVKGYLDSAVDPPSQGYAAVIEWVNHQVATRADIAGRDRRYGRPRRSKKRGDPSNSPPGAAGGGKV